MKRLIFTLLFITGVANAQPHDAIATANAEAVDATAITRMVHIIETAMETSTPKKSAEVMVDSFVRALSGAPFPRDATGNFSATSTVNLSAGWQLIQFLASEVAFMALRNSYNINNPEGVDADYIEWGMASPAAQALSATSQASLRYWHRRVLINGALE